MSYYLGVRRAASRPVPSRDFRPQRNPTPSPTRPPRPANDNFPRPANDNQSREDLARMLLDLVRFAFRRSAYSLLEDAFWYWWENWGRDWAINQWMYMSNGWSQCGKCPTPPEARYGMRGDWLSMVNVAFCNYADTCLAGQAPCRRFGRPRFSHMLASLLSSP